MKTFLLFGSRKQVMLFAAIICFAMGSDAQSSSQSSNELIFQNSSLYSGLAGADNAVYLFPQVNNDLDALVKIVGRSSSLVTLSSIDLTSTGFMKAFQPQIAYNGGEVSGAQTWWMEFQFSFVNKNSSIPATINSFDVTALDIDGNGNRLREWDAFYGANSYILETGSQLSVTDLVGSLVQSLMAGKKFNGALPDYSGIDTSETTIMTTLNYQNTNSFVVRLGASTTNSVSGANRMYSMWFKSFSYELPIQTTLPLHLLSFTATLADSKVDLKWTTVNEVNVSHFIVEKSYDGRTFQDAGLVFAFGNTIEKKHYSIPDDIGNITSGIIYYRLRTFDNDGKTQLSETRIVRIGKQQNVSLLAYPNPVKNELRITLPSAWQNKMVKIEIFNSSGQLVKAKTLYGAGQTEILNVSDLNRGFYVVRAASEAAIAQQAIVKE